MVPQVSVSGVAGKIAYRLKGLLYDAPLQYLDIARLCHNALRSASKILASASQPLLPRAKARG